MPRAERFLIDWLPVASKIVPGQMARIDTPALPVEAVREALANAFIHRDYTSAAGSVSVALYDDRLEIISPGELHFGLTPEKLYLPHESKPWNPWIAKVFYRRGLIETWGRGTLKIASLMQEAGLAAPTLRVKDEFVTMTFEMPVSLARSKKGSTPKETPGKTQGKTPNLILDWLSTLASQAAPSSAPYANYVPMANWSVSAPPKAATGRCDNERSCQRQPHPGQTRRQPEPTKTPCVSPLTSKPLYARQLPKPLARERLLGERKVDVVIETPDDTRPIVAIAHATGVQIK